MGAYLVDLLTLAISAALLPIWIILVLVLLTTEGGLRKAAPFVAGTTLARLVQGVLFGVVLAADPDAESDAGLIVPTLLLVLGILLLVAAYKKWAKVEDPDAPPPAWMTGMEKWSPARAFGIGLGAMLIEPKGWVITMSALGIVTAASVGTGASVGLFLVYLLVAQSLTLLPVLAAAVAPAQSAGALIRLRAGLERYNRPIAVAASLIFGVLFLWQGIAGIIAA